MEGCITYEHGSWCEITATYELDLMDDAVDENPSAQHTLLAYEHGLKSESGVEKNADQEDSDIEMRLHNTQ